jgi:hypothetical protein
MLSVKGLSQNLVLTLLKFCKIKLLVPEIYFLLNCVRAELEKHNN